MKFALSAIALTILLATTSLHAQGRLARVVSTIIHPDETKTLSNRDLVKRTMEQQTYSIGGVLKMKRIFQLDRAGKVKSGLAFDGTGKPLFKFKYSYDELDRLETEKVSDMQDAVVRVLKTVYDDQGKAHRIAKNNNFNPKLMPKLHKEIFEHPELLEKKGKKLQGNQLNFKK